MYHAGMKEIAAAVDADAMPNPFVVWKAMYDAAPVLATAPAEPPKDTAALIRDCANTLDQLFRQRHTMKDVETELRRFARLVNSNPSCDGRAPCSIEDCRWPDCE